MTMTGIRQAEAPAAAAGADSAAAGADAAAAPSGSVQCKDEPFAPQPPRRLFNRRRRRILKALTLVLATALSLLGTVGQFYFVDRADDVAEARAEEMRAIETRTETLRTAQAAYFNAQVQGNLLYALNPADRSVNKGITGDLYQVALLDRSFPFRSILGELAIAGAIEFKPVNDRYNAIRTRAMTDFSYDAYMAVGAFEHEIIDQAMALHGALQDRFWKAQEEKEKSEAIADRRRALLIAVAGAATCLFLLANLIGVRD